MDVRPPVIVRTEPDTFSTLTDLQGSVTFHFDERISESAAGVELDDAVTVSPRTGDVRVSHGRTTLSVSVEGGFRPGLLYRITLLPVVRDMFGNALRDPFELVVSTGGAAPPTAVAGQVWNRTTGSDVPSALVHAVSPDSLVHVARTDQTGIYAFRYLPDGTYRVTAFEDTDRDGELDARETQGVTSVPLTAGDTLILDIGMLPYDTTPPNALSATALDSVTVALEFDDYLDEASPASAITVELSREDGAAPGVARVFHEREYGAYVLEVVDSLVRLDSLEAAARNLQRRVDSTVAADSTAADSTALAPPPADSTAVATVPPLGGAGQTGPASGQRGRAGGPGQTTSRPAPPLLGGGPGQGGPHPRPTRRVVALLDAPLERDVEYQVDVSDVVSINGTAGGGGEVTLMLAAARPAAADSIGAGGAPSPASGVPSAPNQPGR